MRSDGFSLIELMVVIAFLAVILLIATPLTLDNIRRARAENEIQTIYSNIAEARQRSVQRSLNYLIEVSRSAVNIYEDQNNDGTADLSEKVVLLSTDSPVYYLQGTVGAGTVDTTAKIATASRNGIIQPNILLFVDKQTVGPLSTPTGVAQQGRHNCITIDFTRVSVGKYNGTTCQVE